MNIVVTRKTSLGAETFARAMVGKNITLQKANSIKILMLNQFKGYINQISGLIRKPEKRYWIFNDGLGGAWRFDFVVYPVQQLVIICAFYAVAINRVLPQRQRSVAQQNEGKSNVMRLSEADLRYIVYEATSRIVSDRLPDIRIDGYDVILGREWKQILNDCQEMGPVEDICLFSPSQKIEGTFALYRRLKNNKYFFTEWIPNPKTGKTTAKLVQIKNVPPILLQAAKGILSN